MNLGIRRFRISIKKVVFFFLVEKSVYVPKEETEIWLLDSN